MNTTPTNATFVSKETTAPLHTYIDTDVRAYSDRGESLCWKSIFAGTFATLLAYSAFLALGLAFGGANLQGAVQGPDTMRGLGIGTVVWVFASVTAALFVGGFVTGHSRRFISERVGRLQGLTVAGIFFMILLMQIGSGIAAIGKSAGWAAGTATTAVGAASENPRIQAIFEDAVGTSTLKSPPAEVVQGIASRVLRGDTQSATNYLAYQANISREEATSRVATLKQQATDAATEAAVATGKTLKFAGWFLFGLMISGTMAAFLAGGIGNDETSPRKTTGLVH